MPVVYDFTKNLAKARVVEESAFLELGTAGARPHLKEGWGVDETAPDGLNFVWAVSRRAELELVVLDPKAARLHFGAWPFRWKGAPDQIATVFVNGRNVASVEMMPQTAEYSIPLQGASSFRG